MSVAPADLQVGKKYNIFRNREHILKELTEKQRRGNNYILRFGEDNLYDDNSAITINTRNEPNVTYSKVRTLHPLISDKITKQKRSIHYYHHPGHYIPNKTKSNINRTLTIRQSLSQSGLLPEMQHHILKFKKANSNSGGAKNTYRKKTKGKTRKNKLHK